MGNRKRKRRERRRRTRGRHKRGKSAREKNLEGKKIVVEGGGRAERVCDLLNFLSLAKLQLYGALRHERGARGRGGGEGEGEGEGGLGSFLPS